LTTVRISHVNLPISHHQTRTLMHTEMTSIKPLRQHSRLSLTDQTHPEKFPEKQRS
ncbi:hypothetical protein BaRGS_00032602, partial [Batillaria attramentaria]